MGRPKGSKNKKTLAAEDAAPPSPEVQKTVCESVPEEKPKRGRPKKDPTEGEPPHIVAEDVSAWKIEKETPKEEPKAKASTGMKIIDFNNIDRQALYEELTDNPQYTGFVDIYRILSLRCMDQARVKELTQRAKAEGASSLSVYLAANFIEFLHLDMDAVRTVYGSKK